ncbi:hypothetical protein Hanom_Chr15g01397611 [Helianthus anomalus]
MTFIKINLPLNQLHPFSHTWYTPINHKHHIISRWCHLPVRWCFTCKPIRTQSTGPCNRHIELHKPLPL